ncbi:FAD-dependent monooxygenase [Actinomadura sp. ATCC 31491]|uniref:FAD-dependent monooxygenase n=1 Tax=Actinomadura luzonensis TaxID=2805427 RepID=A0ABT0G6P0_9ACTN|nr:FAD-dependent monooxygenase [Actinomadura luzonensis]MCK2220268.1 FAD-dependent monooxygenase [Actinomadura luzonensis]
MRKRVIIIGAGIAGLAAALRLGRDGWEPVVVERAPARRTGGYVLILSGMGLDAAERMGVLAGLAERRVAAFDLAYLRPDGRPRFTVPRAAVRRLLGDDGYALLRGDVEDVLHEAAAGHAELRFGTTVTALAQDGGGVDVTLSDGTSERADLVVGADGLHSAVRALAFGPEERYRRDLGHMVAAVVLGGLPAGARPGAFTTAGEVGRTFTVADMGGGRAAAFFTWAAADPAAELAAGAARSLGRAFPGERWVATELIAGLREEETYFDSVSQIVMDRWSAGRVVLLGDAAWCVTLFAGYGSSLAVGGAALLGDALDRSPGDVPAALRAWEAGLRPEVSERQRKGRANTGAHAPRSKLELALRDLPLRLAAVPPVTSLLSRRLDFRRH